MQLAQRLLKIANEVEGPDSVVGDMIRLQLQPHGGQSTSAESPVHSSNGSHQDLRRWGLNLGLKMIIIFSYIYIFFF